MGKATNPILRDIPPLVATTRISYIERLSPAPGASVIARWGPCAWAGHHRRLSQLFQDVSMAEPGVHDCILHFSSGYGPQALWCIPGVLRSINDTCLSVTQGLSVAHPVAHAACCDHPGDAAPQKARHLGPCIKRKSEMQRLRGTLLCWPCPAPMACR